MEIVVKALAAAILAALILLAVAGQGVGVSFVDATDCDLVAAAIT